MNHRLILITLLLLLSGTAIAEIYVDQTPEGVTKFSDTPNNDSKSININQNSNSVSSKELAPSIQNKIDLNAASPVEKKTEQPERKPYIQFRIEKPKDQQTFQNQSSIPVSVYIRPELQPGDTIQLIVDDKPYGNALASSEFSLNQIDRGTHKISATLMNRQKLTIKKTSTITIFVHRRSAILQPN